MEEIVLSHSAVGVDGIRYRLSHSDEYYEHNAAKSVDSHIHSCTELYLNLSGDVSFLVKNAVYPIRRGDLVISRASELHHCMYHSSCIHEHFCLWIEERADGLLSFLDSEERHHVRLSPRVAEELIALFCAAHTAMVQNDAMAASTYLMRILLMLRDNRTQPCEKCEETLPRDVQQVVDYINLKYGEITNIRRVAEKFFISPSTLNRRFAKHLHLSPKEYLESVKLSNAKRMLDEGKSVTRVCFLCGYADSSHFIRNFKKKFHITPHQYKARGGS